MTNNDILRRLRYIFNYNDSKMMSLFALSDYEASRAEISSWLKKDDDEDYKKCNDKMLARFLNGLIVEKRGKKEGVEPKHESELNNNIIFNKLKIALNLKAEDVIEILGLAEVTVSKHELSAFFRRPGHKHYRECKDQVLRAFLKGVQIKYRADSKVTDEPDTSETGFSWG